jgi:Fe-S cluster assembly scaffold protein SufB
VYVPKGVDAGVVLRGGYAPVGWRNGQSAVTRTLVVAEPDLALLIWRITRRRGPEGEGDALSVAGVEIVAGENAQVTYVNFQRHGERQPFSFSERLRWRGTRG